ncbi:GDSL-type esterase/lipase family protein [Myxacorys almedinensis]|uniref:Lysophospholipase n=1 Tax=Myxacorys almedinensis A TaxID=2690445 RepID=A0A8J8CN22_9CYAN|nr:GDSL-type esterase/lipase family protein [Myxacorys almedinensis]NDJ17957.1 lysophospholipase [Myxacorys almedinensis A]
MFPPPFIAQPDFNVVSNSLTQIAHHVKGLARDSHASPRGLSPISRLEFESSRPEFSRPEYLAPHDDRGAPRTGSQLYAQRLAALRVGKLYTRLSIDSFREMWQQAVEPPTYEQWRKLLALEAKAAAGRQSSRDLSVLLGDSLSLWFPSDRLPPSQIWLNQGISGDTTRHILSRLAAFENVRPTRIYVMAGVNDLKSGASDTEIVWNLQTIVRRLRAAHPQAQVVVQSILPTRSLTIENDRIPGINRRVAAIAQREGAVYLNLYTQFVAHDGEMMPAYTVDGIHLSAQGYERWQAAVQQAELQIAQGR